MTFRSLRFAVVALAGSVALAVGVTSAVVGHRQTRAIAEGQLDRLLVLMARGLAHAASIREDAPEITRSPWRGTGVEYRIWSDERGTIAASLPEENGAFPEPLDPAPDLRPAPGGQALFDVGRAKTYRCLWTRLATPSGTIDILLAHPSSYETRRLGEVAVALGIVTALAIVLAAATAWVWVGWLLRPVARARADSPGDRIPLELRPILAAAREREERRRSFTADTAHELRTPLALARSTLELAAERPAGDAGDRGAIVEALGDLRSLERLLEALALFAQLDEPATVPDRSARLRLDDLLRQVAEVFLERGAAVEVGALAAAEVEGNEALLERLFSNLIDNAVKYGPAGGAVRVELSLGAGTCEVAVEDSGGGVPQEELERLFERFYRTGEARETGRPGTGLGLAIARAIARAHGGDVIVQVIPGQRTRFVVRLPRR